MDEKYLIVIKNFEKTKKMKITLLEREKNYPNHLNPLFTYFKNEQNKHRIFVLFMNHCMHYLKNGKTYYSHIKHFKLIKKIFSSLYLKQMPFTILNISVLFGFIMAFLLLRCMNLLIITN